MEEPILSLSCAERSFSGEGRLVLRLTNEPGNSTLGAMKKLVFRAMISLACASLGLAVEVRSLDGQGNNAEHPDWGAAGAHLQRFSQAYYEDGMASMAGHDRPNPRMVSQMVADQGFLTQSGRGLSDMTWCWGQFLDHDISLVLPNPEEFIPVMVDDDDAMAPMIPVMRSQADPATGTSKENPRQQVNTVTAFIDASMVYGHSEERAAALRAFEGGRLIARDGSLLPWNTAGIEMENPSHRPEDQLYMAGDVRANENPALISMHTLWVREHNRWAAVLAEDRPLWNDEQLYQHARRMVSGQIQNITYQEFLPALLGPYAPKVLEASYDPTVNPGMFNEVSGALYRIGHTMVSAHIMQVESGGKVAPEGSFHFREAFFQPDLVNDAKTVDRVLMGVASKHMQEIDPFVVDDLRNFLFAEPGHGGMDLIAINLQRGRDHGLPTLNEARAALGLEPHADFSSITSNTGVVGALETAYAHVDDVDLWIGAMSEDHLEGASMGETVATAVAMQFRALRDGDRFFFLTDVALTGEEKSAILETTLADVIRRNTTNDQIQDQAFFAPPEASWVDSDRDGSPDIREVIAGTDPENAQSRFHVAAVVVSEGEYALRWASVPGRTYVVQHTVDLGHAWNLVGSVVAEGEATRFPVNELGQGSTGFFRVAIAP